MPELRADVGNAQLARKFDQLDEIVVVLFAAVGLGRDVVLRGLECGDVHFFARQHLLHGLDLLIGDRGRVHGGSASGPQDHIRETLLPGELHVGFAEWSQDAEARLPFDRSLRLCLGGRGSGDSANECASGHIVFVARRELRRQL